MNVHFQIWFRNGLPLLICLLIYIYLVELGACSTDVYPSGSTLLVTTLSPNKLGNFHLVKCFGCRGTLGCKVAILGWSFRDLNLVVRNSAALDFNMVIFLLLKLNFLGGTKVDLNDSISCLHSSISFALNEIMSAVPYSLVLALSTE